jgi:hypothetical protein
VAPGATLEALFDIVFQVSNDELRHARSSDHDDITISDGGR